MNEAFLSIIIPVYNVEPYLRQCIDSVLNQTYKNIEVICVNDGSTDSSLAILREYQSKDSRLKVVNQNNTGLSGARNAGMKIATGDYIMFLDGDDWLDTDACEVMIKTGIEKDSDIVVCSYVKEFTHHSSVSNLWEVEFTSPTMEILRKLYGPIGMELRRPQDTDLQVSACMQIIKAEKAKQVLFLDTKKIGTEDLLYQVQTYSLCNRYTYIDKPFYHYRRSEYGTLTTKYMAEKYERWQNLYDILYQLAYDKPSTYKEALSNRIAFSMIGIGLNEILSDKNIFAKSLRLKQILKTDRYKDAFAQLKYRYLPFHWKVFFYLCKYRMTLSLVIMLELMEFLRKRVK